MKAPKRIITISTLLTLGSLAQVGTGIFMILSPTMMAALPPGPLPPELNMAISIIGGLFTLAGVVGVLNRMPKARVALFTYICLSALLSIYLVFFAESSQSSAIVSKSLQLLITVSSQLLWVGTVGWALFSKKSSQFFVHTLNFSTPS